MHNFSKELIYGEHSIHALPTEMLRDIVDGKYFYVISFLEPFNTSITFFKQRFTYQTVRREGDAKVKGLLNKTLMFQELCPAASLPPPVAPVTP